MHVVEEQYASRHAASVAAAAHLATSLRAALQSAAGAGLVVSGGSTPADCFAELSRTTLDWSRVTVTLSDERWVDPSAADSNERLVRDTLLCGEAAAAGFLPLFRAGTNIDDACSVLHEELAARQFSTVLLGMGEDGHFASLFPDADVLSAGLNPDAERLCLPVTTAASTHPRVTLTLAALTRGSEIVLLYFGDTKWRVFDRARNGDDTLPVSRLLQQRHAPLRAIWAP